MVSKIRLFLLVSGCIALFAVAVLEGGSALYPGQVTRTLQATAGNLPDAFILIPLYGICAIFLYFILKPKTEHASESEHVSQPEHAWRVWDTGDALHCVFRGEEKTIFWNSVIEIQIVTTDEGPFLPDVFWRFRSLSDEIVFPQMALGEKEVTNRVTKLPGYDSEASIRAMSSTENAEFLVWKRKEINQ